jgi:hypothetical protein
VREVERLPERLDLGPPDTRDAAFAQADRAARHDAEPFDPAIFLALVQGELQAEADAEHRFAVGDACEQDVVEPALAQAFARGCGRTNAR